MCDSLGLVDTQLFWQSDFVGLVWQSDLLGLVDGSLGLVKMCVWKSDSPGTTTQLTIGYLALHKLNSVISHNDPSFICLTSFT